MESTCPSALYAMIHLTLLKSYRLQLKDVDTGDDPE